MGEPEPEEKEAADILSKIDVNERLRQAYFEPRANEPIVPEAQKAFPLAKAVAASACVPLLFQPLPVSDMYDGRRVQLVDGGVHDNQGVQALLDMDCRALIISDASGLMADKRKPSPYAVSVAGRSSSIYGSRVRIEQIVRAQTTRPTALMHLLSGVPLKTIDPLWFDSPNSPRIRRSPTMESTARSSAALLACAPISTRSARSRRTR